MIFSCSIAVRTDYQEFLLIADDYRHQVYMSDADGKNVSAVKFPAWDRPIGKVLPDKFQQCA